MEYLTDSDVNPNIEDTRQVIEGNTTLCSTLRIFGKLDQDHSGKLEYAEFVPFGKCMGLNAEETEVLWHRMDEDNSGAIDIVELTKWFRQRMYKQRQRLQQQQELTMQPQKSTPRITEDTATSESGETDDDQNEVVEVVQGVSAKSLQISDTESESS